ncbi:MAG: glycosyltransferase family 39 protein, partial [Myxococcota bacterium]
TPAIMNDGPIFIAQARAMAAGDWRRALDYDQHPLYPLLTMLAERLTGDWVTAGVAVSIVSGVAAVLFLYALLRDTFSRRIAGIGAVLLAVHPYALTFSSDVQSDGLYLAAFVGALALLWKGLERRSLWFAAGAGLASGIAYLARPEGAGVILIGLAVVSLESARRRWPLMGAARWTIALGLGAALAMAPYIALLSERAGTLTFTQKKSIQNLLGIDAFESWIDLDWLQMREETPHAPPPFAPRELAPQLLSVVPSPKGPLGQGANAAALSELVQNALSAARYEIVLVILLGLWALRGPMGLRGRFMLLAAVLYSLVLYGLVTQAGYVSRRHTLPVSVLLFGYAAAGVPVLGRGILRVAGTVVRVQRPIQMRSAVAAGLIAVAALSLGKGLRPHRQSALSERLAAEWILEHGVSGEAVAAGKHRVAFYAEAPWVDPRRAPRDEPLLPYLRRQGVRYLVLDEDEQRTLFERDLAAPAGLRLLHEERANGYAAWVYELLQAAPAQSLE